MTRIVIADRAKMLREMIGERINTMHPVVVDYAGDGNELVRIVEDDTYDAVIADCRLPPDGIETIREIRGNNLKIPILVYAKDASISEMNVMAAGASRFISREAAHSDIIERFLKDYGVI